MFFYAALEKDKHFLLDSPGDRLVPGRDQAVFCLSGVIRLPGPVRLLFPARARAASLSRAAGTVPLPGTARAVLFAGALTFSLGSGGALGLFRRENTRRPKRYPAPSLGGLPPLGQLSEAEQISEAEYRAGASVFESTVVKQQESRRQGGNRERPRGPGRVKSLKAGKAAGEYGSCTFAVLIMEKARHRLETTPRQKAGDLKKNNRGSRRDYSETI